METFDAEVSAGRRFEFGANWSRFLQTLNTARIEQAKKSLQRMLEIENLEGMSFVDVGSGSGLFSLVARQLGARVHSFDFDPQSVACTQTLKDKFFPGDGHWTIERASALDHGYLKSLGKFDVVYSWGVLHHTGAMWDGLAGVSELVADKGKLYIAIYNDQGGWSRRWTWIKKMYNRLPSGLKLPYAMLIMLPRELMIFLIATVTGRPLSYVQGISNYSAQSRRGMSYWHDLIDWVGGYPFEVATPEQIFDFYRERGFVLCRLTTNGGGIACNEFVFRR